MNEINAQEEKGEMKSREMPKKPELRTCNLCGYTWWSRSNSPHVTCPNCNCKIGYMTQQEVGKTKEKKNEESVEVKSHKEKV